MSGCLWCMFTALEKSKTEECVASVYESFFLNCTCQEIHRKYYSVKEYHHCVIYFWANNSIIHLCTQEERRQLFLEEKEQNELKSLKTEPTEPTEPENQKRLETEMKEQPEAISEACMKWQGSGRVKHINIFILSNDLWEIQLSNLCSRSKDSLSLVSMHWIIDFLSK